MGTSNYSGENIEWHQKKIREYFDECFNTIYNPFLCMSDTLLIPSLLDFINDETHTGPEAESAKAFLNDQQITIIAMITDCVQQLQSMMQKGGFAGLVPLLDDFLADLSEDESQDPVIKTQHLKKVIEDFANYNTIFNEVHPKVTEIRNKANSIVSGCDVISINELINPDPAASVRAFDDFATRDKASGFVPEFNQKFLTFHEEHSNDIAGSTFKQLLDDIVRLLKSIIDGMNKGTFDITRYEETKGNIRWIDPKDVEGLEAYLRTYKLYLQGLVDRCQVYKYDPVNMSSGNYINDRTDLEVGTDTKITFRRFYNARSEFKGAMGRGWSCNSDVHLYKEDNGDIRAIYIDGREGIYRKPENSKAAQKENTPELTFDGEEGATNKSSSVSETYYEIHGEPGKLVEDNYGYKLIREDLSYEEYDKDGYLVAKGDNTGENTRYTLGVFTKNDDNGESIRYALPVKIETKEGSYISLSYNEDGILTRVSTSQGKNVTYGYEKREDEYFLTAATYPNGSTRRYTYNEEGLIHKVISPDGIIALTNEYDEQRRVIHQIFPDGGEMSYSYDDEKNITTATEQNGLKVEYLSDERGRHTGTRYIGLSDDYASQDVENGKNIIEEKYTYNERNQKTSVTDKNGHTVRFSYDNRGNLTKIVGPEGLSESYTYDAEGRLIAKKDSEGNSYRFIYDFDGNLYCVTDPLGNRTKYDYKDGRVVRIRDAENNAISVTYDEKGNISSITDKVGVTTRYICDNSGRVTKTIDAEGNETSYTMDESDNITSVTDPLGNTTSYTYNAADLLTEVINPDGTTRRWDYNEIGHLAFYTDESDHTTAIRYNTSWKEESITLPNGGMMHYDYDLLGNLVKITDPMGRKTVYSHDNNGNVITVGTEINKEENDGTLTETIIKNSYTYDKLGRIKTETDGEGNTTTYDYDKNGNLICKIDALGGQTCYEYDALGRVIKVTDAIGREESCTYDKNGNIKTVTDAAGVVTENHYEKGRLLKVTQKTADNDAPEIIINEFEYDSCGRICKQVERDGFTLFYEYDKAGRANKVTGSNGRVMVYFYDSMGRVIETDDCGTITKYRYTGTGKLSSVIDALGNETRYTYNDLDLLSSVERAEGTIENEITDDNFPQVDGKGHITVYEHDLSGKLVSVTDALGQKDIYRYDESGELISQIDRDGNETVYTRDKNGNITGIKYADGNEVRYKYNAIAVLEEVKEKIGLTKIESDILGRTIKVTDPTGETVGYEYGPKDEKTAVIYPDGKRAEYRYDVLGRLLELKKVGAGNSDSDEIIRYSYDDNGHLSKKLFPNGAGTCYDYYQGGLLKSLTSADKDGILDRYEYAYNEKGNRAQIKRYRRDLRNVSGIYDYAYDELGRLTESKKDGILQNSYSYDAFGNRIAEETEGVRTTYSYDVVDRLIGKIEHTGTNSAETLNTTYAYDRRGNLIREYENDALTKTYDFNLQGMLEKSVVSPDTELQKKISYTYNFMGQRVSKKSDLEEIRYLTDITRDHSNLLKETVNGKARTYTYDASVVSFSTDRENFYYQTDELGSTMYLTGTDGASYSPYAYDPFGNRLDPKTGRRKGYSVDGNIIQPFAFTGYREEENGLYYAQARSYDPRSGRFTGEDRVRGIIEFPETRNHYLYCRNNPVIYVDDNGLWPSLKDIGNGIKDAAVGMVTQFKEDPAKALVSLGTGIVVGAGTAAIAAACVAAAPASAAIAVGVLAYAGAGAFTGAVSSIAGQVVSKDFKKNGINWKEVGISTLGGAVGGAFFGGISGAASSAAASTAGSMATKIGSALTSKVGRYATAFIGGFIGGSTADVAGQVMASNKTGLHKFEDVNAGHAIGTGIFGGIQGVATYGLSQTKPGQAFGNLINNKIVSPVYGLTAKGISALVKMCTAESGSNIANAGYYQDEEGRWHRPNGEMSSEAKVDGKKYDIDKLSIAEIDRINTEAKNVGSRKTWRQFLEDPNNQAMYGTLEEAKEGYIKVVDVESPWPDGYDPKKHIVKLKEGDTFNMVLDKNQKVTRPGGFGIKEDVPSVDFARKDMAIKDDWKKDCGKVAKFRVKKGVELYCPSGPIGPQVDTKTDTYLPGNTSLTQYDLFNGMGTIDRNDYIEYVPGSMRPLN
ncbi:MAG: DUF6531 domain-containing protein [Butyrivibrio hungatei]|nr:DUF6531 domain-containing protein [Butyrivibrio hungatei]